MVDAGGKVDKFPSLIPQLATFAAPFRMRSLRFCSLIPLFEHRYRLALQTPAVSSSLNVFLPSEVEFLRRNRLKVQFFLRHSFVPSD